MERTYSFYNSNEGTEKPGLTGTVLNSKQWFERGDYTDFDQIIKRTVTGGVVLNLITKVNTFM